MAEASIAQTFASRNWQKGVICPPEDVGRLSAQRAADLLWKAERRPGPGALLVRVPQEARQAEAPKQRGVFDE